MLKKISKIRLFLWVGLLLAVLFFLYKAVVPGGRIVYVNDFKKFDDFISKLGPVERIKDGNLIIGDPVYFTLRTPRAFDKAKLKIVFERKNTGETCPIIEAGVLVDNTVWRYDLKPIQNEIIDKLAASWEKQEENGLLFLQKEKKFDSVEDFLKSAVAFSEMAVYNYHPDKEFILSDYDNGAARAKELPVSVRGAYEFYTYIKDEDLDFQFIFSDLNLNKDEDKIEILLFYENELIAGGEVADDGVAGASGEKTWNIVYNFKQARLGEGVYKIEVKANDDIVTERIKTAQSKISFANKLWIESFSSDFALFTDSRNIHAQTVNPASLQVLEIEDAFEETESLKLAIDKTYELFSLDGAFEASKLNLQKDDIIISGDGVFAFQLDSLINPGYKKADRTFDSELTDYVLADYRAPMVAGGVATAEIEFDLTRAYREIYQGQLGKTGAYSFIISVPGLNALTDGAGILIKEIQVELFGKSLFEKIKDEFLKK